MLINIAPETLWLIMGLVFILLELVIPGLIIVFFGAGALITCITTWAGLTQSLTAQVIIFAVSSTLFVGVVRWLILKYKKMNTEETTNFNIEIGRIVDVIEMIEPGQTGGKVRYQGADWNARCQTKILPGDSVRITGCDNLTLIVEPLLKQ